MAGTTSSKKQKKVTNKKEKEHQTQINVADTESEDDGLEETIEQFNDEEAAPAGETDVAKERRLKMARKNNRKNARQRCYRAWAKKSGAGDAETPGEFGNDILSNTLSISDINRMATWAPECVEIGSSLDEFKLMLGQRDERLGKSAAHVLRVNVEGLARNIVLELTGRCLESNGPQTISPAHVRSLLRPYEKALEVSSIAPDGLVRFGQMKKKTNIVRKMTPNGIVNSVEETEQSILPMKDVDEEEIVAERKFAKANHLKLLKELDKDREDRRSAKKSTREAAKQANTAGTTA